MPLRDAVGNLRVQRLGNLDVLGNHVDADHVEAGEAEQMDVARARAAPGVQPTCARLDELVEALVRGHLVRELRMRVDRPDGLLHPCRHLSVAGGPLAVPVRLYVWLCHGGPLRQKRA